MPNKASIWEVRFARFSMKAFFFSLMHYLWDLQVPSFSNIFFKTGFDGTIQR